MDEKQLTQDIDAISKNIRRKYRALKRGVRESDDLLTKTYKPILEPLQIISQKLDATKQPVVKKEEEEADEYSYDDDDALSRQTKKRSRDEVSRSLPSTPRFVTTEVVAETPHANMSLEDVLATPEGRHDAQEYVENMFQGPLARKYLHMALSDERDRLMDHTYGVRNVQDKWMVGNSPLEINEDDDNFYIAGKRYRGTPGLYELLFMKHPDDRVYDELDLAAYKSILLNTNAHKHYYLPGAKVNTNKGSKYKDIISRLFPPGRTRSGRGHTYMEQKAKVDYVHWNDPNELVERLRLLVGSQRAGHTGHNNEIVSILEELREAGIIL
jgi:hypothetical protein